MKFVCFIIFTLCLETVTIQCLIFFGFRSENYNGEKLPSATPYNNLNADQPLLVETTNDRPSTRLEKQEPEKERITKLASNIHKKKFEKVRKQNTEVGESKEICAKGNNQPEKEKKFKEFKEKGNNFAKEVTSCLLLNKFVSLFFPEKNHLFHEVFQLCHFKPY